VSRPELAVTSPATPGEVGPLRRRVEALCADAGASAQVSKDVALAASEALTNVVMHAYVDRDQPGEMRLRASLDDGYVALEIEDDGVGIRPRLDSPGGGMGLALIASLAAELELGRGASGAGARVRMGFALG